jgi:hypothetical protein
MGHKGVSKRKPKKTNAFSKDNLKGSSSTRAGADSSVQSLVNVNGNGTALNRDGTNSLAEANKSNRKGK